MAAGPPAVVLSPGEGRAIDLGNFAMVLKAGPDQTAGEFSLLEASEPPGFGPPMHIHTNCAEAFYILEGEYRVFIGDDEWACPAGSYIYIPKDVRHGFRVGSVRSRKLNIYLPAAMVGYFDELSAAIASGAADDSRLNDIAERAGMQVTGPVPEGYL